MQSARWSQLSPLTHNLLMTLGVGAVYWWLHVPFLQLYSVQFFAVLGICYFILKKMSQAQAKHFLPATMSIETILVTSSLLLLIGATGGTSSWFYPLTYLGLFMVVFSSNTPSSIFSTLLIMLFLYGTSSQLHQHELVAISSLPIVMIFLIFAKLQHEEVIRDRLIIQAEEAELQKLANQDQTQS